MRSKLQAVVAQTGIEIPELKELIELPPTMRFVWYWFIDLHNSRTSSGFASNPIQYSEIKSYFDLKDIVPMEWEVQLIKQLDLVALQIQAEEAEKKSKKNSKTKK